MPFSKIFRDPLFHFLVIGLVLFVFSFWMGKQEEQSTTRIKITGSELDDISKEFRSANHRSPSNTELDDLIEARIREEIFFRQALDIGLAEDDGVVRRHLVEKLEFLIEGLVDAVEPTDQELEKFLLSNSDKFRSSATIKFEQIYFDLKKRGDNAERDARNLLVELVNGSADGSKARGDISLTLPRTAYSIEKVVANQFSPDFARVVFQLEQGKWHGPIPSVHGQHLVFIHEQRKGHLPELKEIHSKVREMFLADRYYKSLLEQYEIVVEQVEPVYPVKTKEAVR
ncbi:MAG: peptidyl-prolyl cis-trans isomerase [Gammaproteobacteria bacterium]|nr:MAG: peptidyl-prolyl cis-trans isomerase [Gammaproteobacteria bacterium]